MASFIRPAALSFLRPGAAKFPGSLPGSGTGRFRQFHHLFILRMGAGFHKLIERTGGDRNLEMLFKEDRNFLIAAALAAQLADHVNVRFEPGAGLPFRNIVEQFSDSFVHG